MLEGNQISLEEARSIYMDHSRSRIGGYQLTKAAVDHVVCPVCIQDKEQMCLGMDGNPVQEYGQTHQERNLMLERFLKAMPG